jgi:multisubunit Na+/H+ antiporter MnhE subunit
MEDLWVYAGAGFAGFLWGAGVVTGAMAVAFMAGLWLGNSAVVQWAVLALIAGYVIGSMVSRRR